MQLGVVTVLGGAAALAACGGSSRSTTTDDAGAGGMAAQAAAAGQSNAGRSASGSGGSGAVGSGGSAASGTGGAPGAGGANAAGAGPSGSGGVPVTPDECDNGACGGAPSEGPCGATVFEGNGEDCADHVWFWDGDSCAETTSCGCASDQCERVHATATECLTANAECIGSVDPTPDPSCEPTLFEDSGDDCIEQSWLWDGSQCVSTTHCGCASGDCDRLYKDYQLCQGAHAACLPNGCQPQDAITGAAMCGTLFGHAFNGWECREVICQCSGADCEDIAYSLEDCESRFARCLARVPVCLATRFPVEQAELGFAPVYPEYTFAVEGYDDLYDNATSRVALFPEWTAAQWVALEDLPDAPEPERCPRIDGLPLFTFPSPFCPAPRLVVLQVGAETFRVYVSLHWELASELAAPSDVEVRIVPHAWGSLSLQIRDAATGLPVLMVVQSMPDIHEGESSWEFAPFSFSAGEKLCFTEPGECRWSFSPLSLQVSTAEGESSVEPLHVADVEFGGATFTVLHGYLFNRYDMGEHACSSLYSRRQSFALVAQ